MELQNDIRPATITYDAREIVYQCNGPNDKNLSYGTIDQARFRKWVIEKLIPTLGKYHLGQPRSIVIMNSATIHKDIKDLIEVHKVGGKLIYLSAYSPEANPIELMVGMYKLPLRCHRSQPQYRPHSTALQCVSTDTAYALSKHSKVPLCEHFSSQDE